MRFLSKCLLLGVGICASMFVRQSTAGEKQPPAMPAATATAEADGERAADADSQPVSVSLDALFASKYSFQGIDLSDGRAVLQPNFAVTYHDWSASMWSNYHGEHGYFDEVDVTIKYSRTVQKLTVAPGYMYLNYPHRGWDPSQEVFVDLALDIPLAPSVSVHYDFDAGKGTYSTFSVSQTVVNPLSLGASLYHQNHYYEWDGFPALELKAAGAFTAGTLSVTPSLSRIITWSNGFFQDENALPSTWLVGINFGHPLTF